MRNQQREGWNLEYLRPKLVPFYPVPEIPKDGAVLNLFRPESNRYGAPD